MTQVLVTGGAGFIGSHLVRDLVTQGHDVAMLVRPTTSLHPLGDLAGSVRLVEGELADPAQVLAALAPWKPEACAHLAWFGDPRTYLSSPENLTELVASLAFISGLLEAGCDRVLVTGTCAEYEPSDAPLTERSLTGPRTLYAAAKLSLLMLSSQLAAQSGARLAWARIFHLYGPFEHEARLVPALIRSLLAGREFAATAGDQVRDYTHVADVASALRLLLESGADGAFNVCSGTPTTVKSLITTAAEIIGRPELVRFGAVASRAWDPPVLCGDNGHLVQRTGWQPAYQLQDGLEQTIAWWAAQGSGS